MANKYKNAKVDLTGTGVTVLYTAPSATTALVKSVLVSEDSGNADTITVHFIGLDQLVKNKAASARPKDLDDLDYLKRQTVMRQRRSGR